MQPPPPPLSLAARTSRRRDDVGRSTASPPSDVELRDRVLSSRRRGAITDERKERGRDCDRDGAAGATVTVTDDDVDGRRGGSGGASSQSSSALHLDDLNPAHSECRHEHRPEEALSPLAAAVSNVTVGRLFFRFSCLTVVRPRLCCPADAAVAAADDVISGCRRR